LLCPVVDELDTKTDVEVLFVNNGSTDNSLEVLHSLRENDSRINFITLSRNFGYQGALDAGIRNSNSDLYCVIDADGEDPPELILEFLEAIDNGSDIAYGVRQSRQEPSYRSALRKFFYRVVGLVSDDPFRLDTGEFSMFTNELKQAALSENNSFPFLRASLSRVGYVSTGVPHDRRMRLGGQSSLNAIGMVNFAVGGLLSSSTFPLRLALYLLPFHIFLMAGLGLTSLIFGSVSPLIVALYIANVLMMIQFAFVSVYLARTYKNGLQRPSSFVVDRLSSKE
jgi:dolichol-phosphate mannosyltransferase